MHIWESALLVLAPKYVIESIETRCAHNLSLECVSNEIVEPISKRRSAVWLCAVRSFVHCWLNTLFVLRFTGLVLEGRICAITHMCVKLVCVCVWMASFHPCAFLNVCRCATHKPTNSLSLHYIHILGPLETHATENVEWGTGGGGKLTVI